MISKYFFVDSQLPERIVSEKYNHFLFFDFCLRYNESFFNEFKLIYQSINLNDIKIFNPSPLEEIKFSFARQGFSDWVRIADNFIEKYGYNEFVIADSKLNWVAIQNFSTNLGLFAFSQTCEQSKLLFEILRKKEDWFLRINDFQIAEQDEQSFLANEFGMDFIRKLVLFYT